MASTTTQTGKPAGHQWAVLMATSGKKHWPPMGRTQWPLTRHRAEGSYVLVGMDGNGDDPIYREAHRALALDTRHVIEDPMFHDSKQSQLMQMADLVAYTVFCHLNRHKGNEFAWGWYEQYLEPRECEQGLQQM
ncbi:DUF3800 domain-containing protein [Streptomyces sp. NPDC059618]|uniref:DUF3800 domain-containing protein n=1 Tax=Streptomyces sp. NPDC059618 TaxID=3346887 RepID=UPI00369E855D